MRLTLRTLLAYLDDILEPEDAEDINKKINESDFATSLMHRVRDCVRRVRLGTPVVEGKGLAADANTVAEYLDNTLEAERVPEFEKICLESDVHLAEVASCHQILTLVLGEPAEIDPSARDRMYQVIHRAGAANVEAPPVQAVKAPPANRTPVPSETPDEIKVKRGRPEVPDYLRESDKARRWPLVATVLATAAAVFFILLLFGPPDLRRQVAGLIGRGSVETPAPEETAVPVAGNNNGEPAASDVGAEPDAVVAPRDETAATEPVAEPEQPAPPAELSLPRTPETEPGNAAPEATPPAPMPEEAAPPTPDETPVPAPEETETAVPTAPEEPPAEIPGATDEPGNPLRPGNREPPDIAALAGAEMGRYLSDTQVAVIFDAESKTWRRLAPTAVIAAGDRVVTLPSFRPAFALANGVTIHAAGPSHLLFEGLDENAIPMLAIGYGRLGMLTVGKAGTQVHLRLGDRDVIVTFGDAQSRLAVEVMGRLTPGSDPEEGPADLAVDLFATSGEIEWSEGGRTGVIKAPEHVTLTAQPASSIGAGQLPDWATRELINPLDERAATALEKELTPDRPLSLALKELSQNRRAEVRALAIRCGGYLGDFEAYVSALNDIDQRASWPAQIESLKAAVARGPQTAALVRETLEKQRGEDAKVLYRMLWGYTGDQLKAGQAEKLVDDLNHDALDIRVLSFWNLQNITGLSLFYRPEYPTAKRKPAVTKWREKLNDGKVVPISEQPAPGKVSARPASQALRAAKLLGTRG